MDFLKSNPFWAIFIIVFMILPIAGAVIHIVLKAFGRRGIDNLPTLPKERSDDLSDEGKSDSPKGEENKPPKTGERT